MAEVSAEGHRRVGVPEVVCLMAEVSAAVTAEAPGVNLTEKEEGL